MFASQEQSRILRRFLAGELNLLISTSGGWLGGWPGGSQRGRQLDVEGSSWPIPHSTSGSNALIQSCPVCNPCYWPSIPCSGGGGD